MWVTVNDNQFLDVLLKKMLILHRKWGNWISNKTFVIYYLVSQQWFKQKKPRAVRACNYGIPTAFNLTPLQFIRWIIASGNAMPEKTKTTTTTASLDNWKTYEQKCLSRHPTYHDSGMQNLAIGRENNMYPAGYTQPAAAATACYHFFIFKQSPCFNYWILTGCNGANWLLYGL